MVDLSKRIKALVVGGNGFIGSHLVDRLVADGCDVAVLDLQERRYDGTPASVHFIRGDLSQSHIVREALLGVDVVYHLAWSTIHEVANQDPAADVHENLVPAIHLLKACSQAGVRRIVYTSSGGTVYGTQERLPIAESSPQNPISAYGVTKLAVEKYLEMFRHLYDLDYVALRPSVPYGPRQNPLGRQGAVAVFLHRVALGLPVTIWGDGSTTRDYFYITDLVDALVASAENNSNHRVFNIGGGQEVSLLQLVQLVEQTVGRQAAIKFMPARNFDVPRLLLDIQLARSELKWQPRTPLDRGLESTWEWMQQHWKAISGR